MRRVLSSALAFALLTSSGIGQEPPESYLRWPTPPSEHAYASIDGEHLKQYVKEHSAIARRYRDHGHPQYWGIITGTEADAENAKWVADTFRKVGLSDVRVQSLDLSPQWMPSSWSVTASVAGTAVKFEAAQPISETPGTAPAGLDVELVDIALASESDLAGRDIRGKAVLFNGAGWPVGIADRGSVKRVLELGAAAILLVPAIPGNVRQMSYPVGTTVPAFTIGVEDAKAVRALIGKTRGGPAPRVQLHLDVKNVPNLQTATVWGSLSGMTDETIFVQAHRDGWFEAANDNGSGMATLLGVAEYFAKVPKEERRRTIYFLGISGHHDNFDASSHWLESHKETFAKTALLINCEHTAGEQLIDKSGVVRRTNVALPLRWSVNGSPRLAQIASRAFDTFGVGRYADPDRVGGGVMRLAPSVQLIDANVYWHTDHDVADLVPPTGLTATARAYAKLIAEVNQLELKDVRPQEK